MLEGLGVITNGTLEIDAAGGPQPLNMTVLLRSSADGSSNVSLIFQGGDYGHLGVNIPGASNPAMFPIAATFSKVQITPAGDALTVVVDGATVANLTIGTSPASGYIGIGSSSTASPQVAISQVSFQ